MAIKCSNVTLEKFCVKNKNYRKNSAKYSLTYQKKTLPNMAIKC